MRPYLSLYFLSVCYFLVKLKLKLKMNLGGRPKDKSTQHPCEIPVLNQVIVAARGATDPFIQSMKRFRESNFKQDKGSALSYHRDFGVGFGHSFGVGSSVKPGILQNIQSCFAEAITKMMIAQKISNVQGVLTGSVKSSIPLLNDPQNKQSSEKSIKELAKNVPENMSSLGFSQEANPKTVSAYETTASKSLPLEAPYGSRVEKVINGFLQNPVLNSEDKAPNEIPHQNGEQHLQSENLLQMVLKHQQAIEELVEENRKLKDIMVEDLKIPPNKLQGRRALPSTECAENDTCNKIKSS